MNEYKYFSAYYDRYARNVDYDAWFDYLVSISSVKDFTGKRVLDLGCGTGILSVKFALSGANVWGVDASKEMLCICDERFYEKKKQCSLINTDISDFKTSEEFDFIFSSCDCINYLDENALFRMFSNVCEMLKDNAVFTFDMISEYNRNIDKKEYLQTDDGYLKIIRNINDNMLLSDITIKKGKNITKEVHKQYLYSKEQIIHASKQSGLDINGYYEALSFLPATYKSDKIQSVFSKAKKIIMLS